jgi:hypothetical protein
MQDSNIPSELEQNEAWEYVCKRELERPDINVSRIIESIRIFV